MRFFNYLKLPLLLGFWVVMGLCLFSCHSEGAKQGRTEMFPASSIEYVNRIEIVDTERTIVQRDIDGNWYYAGMELVDSVAMQRVLSQLSAERQSAYETSEYPAVQHTSAYVVFEGPHNMLPDTLRRIQVEDGKFVICATNAHGVRCTNSVMLDKLLFVKLPAIIDQR